MPTVRIPSYTGGVLRAYGGSLMVTEAGDYRVASYTGILLVDGEAFLSPGQVRSLWVECGASALAEADQTAGKNPEAHYRARGRVTAYAMAIVDLDHVNAAFRKQDAAGVSVVHCRLWDVARVLRGRAKRLNESVAPGDGLTEVQRGAVRSAVTTLVRAATELERLHRYEWLPELASQDTGSAPAAAPQAWADDARGR